MNRNLIDLFITFAKIGVFTFGGGYAMIPLIQREAVTGKGWVTDEDILDIVAIAESTPGPIAINAATFIGRKVAGVKGAVCATLGVTLPSFAIIATISLVLRAFQGLRAVRYAFWGIRAGVLALILKALWTLFAKCSKDAFSLGVMAASLLAAGFLRVNTMGVIVAAGLAGILRRQFGRAKP